jgi:hypothetical protein
VAVAPGFDLRVGGVAFGLLLQLPVGHRPHVELDEAEERSAPLVGDLDEDVGGDRPLLPPVVELLPCLPLTLEAPQGEAGRQGRLERHVYLAEPGGMGEEERVGLATLPATGRRPAGDDRLALAGRPEVVRRRAAFAVGAAAAGEPLLGEPLASVAQGPGCRPRIDLGELVLRHHTVGGQEVEDVEVEVGERRHPVAGGSRSAQRRRSSRRAAARRASARAPESVRPSGRHVAAAGRRCRPSRPPLIFADPSARRYGAGRPRRGSRRGAAASPAPRGSCSRGVRSEQPRVRRADRSVRRRRGARRGRARRSRADARRVAQRRDRADTRWTLTEWVETRARSRRAKLALWWAGRGMGPCLSGWERLARSVKVFEGMCRT